MVNFASLVPIALNILLFSPEKYPEKAYNERLVKSCNTQLQNQKMAKFPSYCSSVFLPLSQMASYVGETAALERVRKSMPDRMAKLQKESSLIAEHIDLLSFHIIVNNVHVVQFIMDNMYPWITSQSMMFKSPVIFACIFNRHEILHLLMARIKSEDLWVFYKESAHRKSPLLYALQYGSYESAGLLIDSGLYNPALYRDTMGNLLEKSPFLVFSPILSDLQKIGLFTNVISDRKNIGREFQAAQGHQGSSLNPGVRSVHPAIENVQEFFKEMGVDSSIYDSHRDLFDAAFKGSTFVEVAVLWNIVKRGPVEKFSAFVKDVGVDVADLQFSHEMVRPFADSLDRTIIDYSIKDTLNCLCLAILSQNDEMVMYLIEQHPRTLEYLSREIRTPAFFAISVFRPDYLKLLLDVTRDPWFFRAEDVNGITPIQLALFTGQDSMVFMLAERKIVQMVDFEMGRHVAAWNLLDLAVYHGYETFYFQAMENMEAEKLRLIVMELQRPARNTLLHLCVVHKYNEKMCEDIVHRFPHLLYEENIFQRTPKSLAIKEKGSSSVVAWLTKMEEKYPKSRYQLKANFQAHLSKHEQEVAEENMRLLLLEMEEDGKRAVQVETRKKKKKESKKRRGFVEPERVIGDDHRVVVLVAPNKNTSDVTSLTGKMEEDRATITAKKKETLKKKRRKRITSIESKSAYHSAQSEISFSSSDDYFSAPEYPDDDDCDVPNIASLVLHERFDGSGTKNQTVSDSVCNDGKEEERCAVIRFYSFPQDYVGDPLEHPFIKNCQNVLKEEVVDESSRSSTPSIEVIMNQETQSSIFNVKEAQNSIAQQSIAQNSIAQHSVAQHSIAQNPIDVRHKVFSLFGGSSSIFFQEMVQMIASSSSTEMHIQILSALFSLVYCSQLEEQVVILTILIKETWFKDPSVTENAKALLLYLTQGMNHSCSLSFFHAIYVISDLYRNRFLQHERVFLDNLKWSISTNPVFMTDPRVEMRMFELELLLSQMGY